MPVLSGRVFGIDGRPVAGATVSFSFAPISFPEIAARTGSDGRFDLNAPVPGTYRLGARSDEHGAGELEVTTGPDGLDELAIRLR